MAKHPLDENGNRRIAQRPVMQIGDVRSGIELGGIEFLAVDLSMPARTFVDVDFQIDVARFHGPVDQRPGAVVRATGHGQF